MLLIIAVIHIHSDIPSATKILILTNLQYANGIGINYNIAIKNQIMYNVNNY